MKSRVAYFGVFTALALIFSYVETLIPINFGIPGIKLGLANLIIIIALYKMSVKEAYVLSVVRVVLAGFIFGNLFSIIYSLAGGLLSLTVMTLLKKTIFIKNALILTASSLALRFFGIIFKVWLAQKIGSEGIGLYQLVFSVYVLATTFAISGTTTAVTRLVAEELALGSKNGVLTISLRITF